MNGNEKEEVSKPDGNIAHVFVGEKIAIDVIDLSLYPSFSF